MISSIANHSFLHQLASSPSQNLAPQSQISSQDGEDDSKRTFPVPESSQKVNAVVTSQESQPGNKKQTLTDAKPRAAKRQTSSPTELNEEELKQVQELKQRDIEVRAHEAAHLAAAGQHAQGGAKFTLTRGPDGRSYAIGGSVSIDTSPESNPEATIRKADQIKRAALAPAEPSGQDRSVAAEATKMKLEALAELAADQRMTKDEPQDESRFEAGNKTQPETSCAVCGGNHPTGPHLESNQRKTDQYLAPIQDLSLQLNQVA
jgi:hypothetical protein